MYVANNEKVHQKVIIFVYHRAFHRGGNGDKLSPSWARGESLPPELVRSTHECCITEL